jgi:hypothetical protein
LISADSKAMGKQCYKCNSIAKDEAPSCEACGAPFGAIPPPARARWVLAMVTVLILVTLALVFMWVQMR